MTRISLDRFFLGKCNSKSVKTYPGHCILHIWLPCLFFEKSHLVDEDLQQSSKFLRNSRTIYQQICRLRFAEVCNYYDLAGRRIVYYDPLNLAGRRLFFFC